MGLSVWYAGYGSNLDAARLDAYLTGGRPTGSGRTHPGSRDPRPPMAAVTATLAGRLEFRGAFSGWGDGGAAAYYLPDRPGPTWCRAYRLTPTQVTDVALQENGLAPHDLDAAELASLDERLAEHAEAGASTRLAVAGRSHPYPHAVRAEASTRSGDTLTVLAVAAPAGAEPPTGTPPVAYLRVMWHGLRGGVGLDADAATAYLRRAGARDDLVRAAADA